MNDMESEAQDGATESQGTQTETVAELKALRTAEDVTHWAYDNEGPEVVATLTFKDGSTATATAPHTGDLRADQVAAHTKALES